MSYTPPNSDNANLIFSGVYTAPQSNAANLIFGLIETYLYQIWTDENYVYAVTSDGLDIYDITSESKYAYIDYSSGFNTVWANDDKIFVGTSNAGIKYLNKTCISGSITDPIDLVTCLNDFSDLTYYHNLTSNYIIYLHGSEDVICTATSSGVDVIKIDPQSYRFYTTISGVSKCFFDSNNAYYTVLSGTTWTIHKMINVTHDWDSPDKIYDVFGNRIINDIFVDGEKIYTATSSGIYVIDESDETYNVFTTNSGIKGTSNNFSSVWVLSNKMYVASEGYLTVINLSDNSVYDWYSTSHAGRANESLTNSDIIDVNVI